MQINPITRMDYPDPDVIRVEDTYYMISTTMHFYPGGVILRSYDLIHWEIAGYVYDKLDSTPEQRLEGEKNSYGRGMWAASLRFHNGKFYVCFGALETQKTYIYSAKEVEGPWERKELEGDYHDSSLLFDGDGRVYLVYGNREIKLVELKRDLSAVKEDGFKRTLAVDPDDVILGYEGSHLYHIGNKYYLFMIHWPKYGANRRTEVCLMADSLEGEFTGGTVLDDDMGCFNQGVAQGGIVEATDGSWYAVLFRDSGAVGRVPVLVPVSWKDGFPVFGENGVIPREFTTPDSRPGYRYEPLYTSDDFRYAADEKGHCILKKQWQWNHEPNPQLWSICPEGGLRIQTGKICTNLTQAVNTLTQRMMWPECSAEVAVDVSDIREGDIAGFCALQGCYAAACVSREKNRFFLNIMAKKPEDGFKGTDFTADDISEKVEILKPLVRLRAIANFADMRDTVEFYYEREGQWKKLGKTYKLYFKLDHFTGCRFGLFCYATRETGGSAVFKDFTYHYNSKE